MILFFKLGEKNFNWIDYCGEDKQLLRSCSAVLDAENAEDLMMTFESTQVIWKFSDTHKMISSAAASASVVSEQQEESPSLDIPSAPSLSRASSTQSGVYMAIERFPVELIAAGGNTAVTNSNRNRFVNEWSRMQSLNGAEDSIAAIRKGH